MMRATIVIARADDAEDTAVHEGYHHWLSVYPNAARPMVPLRAGSRVTALARAEGWPAVEVVEQRTGREESIVQALTAIRCAR